MINAIIIDDEPQALESLNMLLEEYCPEVNVCGTARSCLEGIKLINERKPDLVFLDVDMPVHSGFDMLEALPDHSFRVIFVTAYDRFALKAIKINPVDYLLKPVDSDDLLAAIEKVKKQAVHENESGQILNLPAFDGSWFIRVDEIIHVEASGSYTVFHTSGGKKFVVSTHLKAYDEVLPHPRFFRCHQSHIINLSRVRKFVKHDGLYVIMENETTVNIARRKKDEFLQVMKQFAS